MDMSEKPPHIQDAVHNNDTERLKQSGRKGGNTTARRKDERKSAERDWREQTQEQETKRLEEANYHILDADGEPVDPDERPE